jgi:hypothetical protein
MKYDGKHIRPAKDGGRIEMYWISFVYEDLNDLSDHGCLLRTREIWTTNY